MHSSRRAALTVLRTWAKGHAYAENLIDREASAHRFTPPDRALLNAMVLGVLRNLRLLDHWIAGLRDGRLDEEARDILRLGLCQLFILGLPDHAAVFETVALAKKSVRGLINAILRRATANRDAILDLSALPPEIAFSHPDWLYQRWLKVFGSEQTEALMAFNNRPAPTFARLNPLVDTPEALPLAPPGAPQPPEGFILLEGATPPALLASGAIYIQDPATRHCVDLLAPRPGERVLDACAAPGGKAFLIAAAQGGGETLVCTDSNEKRLPRLRENLQRLRCEPALIGVHDWTQPPPAEWLESFDAILLDVPCSNTGVFRRRVDVRWRFQPEDLARLLVIQRRILDNALLCLRPGGRLVYSTCSLEPEENEGQVEALLGSYPFLSLVEVRQSLPQRDDADGSFSALLEKRI